MHNFRVGEPFDEFLYVATHAYVRPLLPLTLRHGRYFVLAVSQNGPRLCRGNLSHLTPVPGFDQAEWLPHPLELSARDGQLQAHTGHPDLHTKQGAVFFGQGGSTDARKTHILNFFRLIDRQVRTSLRGEHAPLVFAGVEDLFPLYQRANSYPHLWSTPIAGNPDRLPMESLCAAARELLEVKWAAGLCHDLERFDRFERTTIASHDVADVLVAAHEGRVDALFVGLNNHRWGRFAPQERHCEFAQGFQPFDEDLIELAVVETLRHGGRVYAVPSREVPHGRELAAVYRFAAPMQFS